MAEWPFSPDFGDEYGGHDPQDITCKLCEADGLHREEVDGRWVLHEEDGTVHRCPETTGEFVFDPVHGFRQK
jgi:hypothetical protein